MLLESFVHLFLSFLYSALACFVLFKNPRLALNRTCFGSICCFALWSLHSAVLASPGVCRETALTFEIIASLGWLFFPSFLFWFVSLLTGQRRILSLRLFYPALFAFPVLGFCINFCGLIVAGVYPGPGGWTYVWAPGNWPFIYILYYALFVGSSIFLLWRYGQKAADPITKKRTRVILFSVAMQAGLVSISNIFLPGLGFVTVPELADMLGVIWVSGMAYAILKYNFLDLNPAMAADHILSAMADSVILCDSEGKVAYANPEAEGLLERPPGGLLGRDLRDLFDHSSNGNGTIGKIMRKNRLQNLPAWFLSASGESIPVVLSSSLVQGHEREPVGVALVARDVREMERARKDLTMSEDRYRNILESMEEGYYEVNLSGELVFFNSSLSRLCGYSKSELNQLSFKALTEKETAKNLFETFNTVFTTGEPARVTDFQLLSKAGEKKDVEASVRLVYNRKKQVTGFAGVVRDITDKKEAARKNERLVEQLMQSQKIEALGTLAGGVAHNFNNLLMGLSGNISMMLLDNDKSNPQYPRFVEMEKCIKNGADLTRQLLGFARGGTMEKRPVSLNRMVEETARMFARTRKELQVIKNLDSNVQTVEVDEGQLEQVLLNLFVNAWQAMPQGGRLILSTQNLKLEWKEAKQLELEPGAFVSLSVQDTGQGIAENNIGRVFDPFFTTKNKNQGTGLGLSSAFGVMRSHGGTIEVQSREGQGSIFTIYLPASQKAAPLSQAALPLEPKMGSETLLLIDDEAMVLEATREMLQKLGYKVFSAQGGREAVDVFSRKCYSIDMVILDMVMPDMSGEETYGWLSLIRPGVRVLLASGYSKRGQAERILNRGCDGFIQKPFTLTQLSVKLREVLDQ